MQKIIGLTCIICSVIAIGLSEWISGIYEGVLYGAHIDKDFVFRILMPSGEYQHWTHMDPYFVLPRVHKYLSISILGFIVLKVIENGKWISFLALFPISFSFYFWNRISWITEMDKLDPQPYLEPIRGSVPFMNGILGILITISFLQLVSIGLRFRKAEPGSTP